jgi:DNA-directed RNA polymerase subunit alpha
MNSILDFPVRELTLYARTLHCLINADMVTLRDVIKHSEYELRKIRNFGRTSLNDLKNCLSEFNLSLRDNRRYHICPHCGNKLGISLTMLK